MTELISARNAASEPRPAQGRRIRSPLAALAAIGLLAGGFGLGWALRPAEAPNAANYGHSRAHPIQAQLAQARAPYVLLAGDSYMELFLPEPLPCGRDVVNAGVSGAKASETLRLLDELRLEPRPAAVLLSVGLNHLLAKGKPDRPDAVQAFRADVETLVGRLGAGGTRVTVLAVPPIPAGGGTVFDAPSIARYTDVLREICTARGCTVLDPFAEAREPGAFWRAKPGIATDNLHLSDLRHYYRPLYAELCR
ncbi:SGNH/GDSL hydrolase family protein [Enterovirga rhinocerotis]|uniref:Lysophospholipase L1-like esterase n=1 Tax=Enterovirga rhinocerotis TaxID=1339210 RepID=A0A4R7BZL8_9HYPH|nr:SGNH/GDSL hydrolase family protein [Enterovirga rhinocerotis]TDR89667.1 lysophospholipase L1-like esterase [Enterovirga rhinocerotis]